MPFAVYGQALNGSVVGNVTDASEAVVTEAVVSLTSIETGQTRQVTTNQFGAYDFVTVAPGAYQLKVTKNGFAAYVQEGVTVAADKVTRVDVVLKLGAVTE